MWSVSFLDAARKSFKKLDKKTQASIVSKLEELERSEDPCAFAKPLRYGLKGHWRLRVGSYRVIFSIEKSELVILVVDVDRRDSIYD